LVKILNVLVLMEPKHYINMLLMREKGEEEGVGIN
jgi:hypothetical protein